LQFR
jgi:hypothetical protein